jgi:hypothetical protein
MVLVATFFEILPMREKAFLRLVSKHNAPLGKILTPLHNGRKYTRRPNASPIWTTTRNSEKLKSGCAESTVYQPWTVAFDVIP